METENDISADKLFTRTKINAIVRNVEMNTVKMLANNVINEFNTFIHSADSIQKHRWEYKLNCHVGIASLILYELSNYFERDMYSVTASGDPYIVNVCVFW
jgi:hypothetical protein